MTKSPNPQSKKILTLGISLVISAILIFLAYHYKNRGRMESPDVNVASDEAPAPAMPTPVAAASPQPKATPIPKNKPDAQTQAAKPIVHASFDISKIPPPPHATEKEFIDYMAAQRGEDPTYLKQRYNRGMNLIANKDLAGDKEINAFLLAPREKFCRKQNLDHAYDHGYFDIGYGVTISGPYLVGRMTSSLDIKPGDAVLEIGTGSGYQSSVLSYLTDKVYTIEIIDPLAAETDKIYSDLVSNGYPEFGNISRKADDGYFGWAEHAPFDKIIVTCGIDHIPPDLLKQLKTGGTMVIPVGPPGAQVVLKVSKSVDASGNVVISREDIYGGRKKVPFVPFTKKGGGTWND